MEQCHTLWKFLNCRAVLVVIVLCPVTEVKDIYNIARVRACNVSTFIKVNDTQIMKGAKEASKRGVMVFSWDQLAGNSHVHHSNTTQWGKQAVSREHYIKYCSGKHCHTWVTCLFHEWTLTNGKWLPRRRKKALCCWEIKLFICIISFIVFLSNVLNHIYTVDL